MIITFYIREALFSSNWCKIDIVDSNDVYGSYSILDNVIDSYGDCYKTVNFKRFKKERIV